MQPTPRLALNRAGLVCCHALRSHSKTLEPIGWVTTPRGMAGACRVRVQGSGFRVLESRVSSGLPKAGARCFWHTALCPAFQCATWHGLPQ